MGCNNKKVVGLREEECQEFGQKIILQEDRMLHRTYDLTEFFDATSGLTLRFQRTNLFRESWGMFVNEFGDAGYVTKPTVISMSSVIESLLRFTDVNATDQLSP
jgi:hypothetical protein